MQNTELQADAALEIVDEAASTSTSADIDSNHNGYKEPFWNKLRRLLTPSSAERAAQYEARLSVLNEAVMQHPEAASGYVLRGELYLEAGFYDLAISDFQHGLERAGQQLQTESWGVVAQAMADRAHSGLERALRYQR